MLGGLFAGSLGWRSIFWFLSSFSGLCVAAVLLMLPETLRRIAANGEPPLTHWYHRPFLWAFIQRPANMKSHHDCLEACKTANEEIKPPKPFSAAIFFKPFMLLGEWDTLCALLFGGTVYTAWSMMVASTTYLLKDIYQFSTIQ